MKIQLTDLSDTVNNLEEEHREKSKVTRDLNQQIIQIETYIQEKLRPILVVAKEKLTYLINTKKVFQEIEINKRLIADYQITKFEIMRELNKKNTKVQYINEISQKIYDDLAEEVKNLLQNWNYPDLTNVSFDQENQDLIVSGKKRKNHGKGYRAILNAAFVIAIMNYARKLGLKHPGLVVLDSPLTTYKEKSNENIIEVNEDVPLDMKQAFFKDLSKIKGNLQIIILENVDPIKELQSNINYIHFTKITGLGRYGFIPIEG